MTNVVPATSTDLVLAGAGAFNTVGLEDFTEADMIMPRLQIGQGQADVGTIINGLTNERYDGTQGIDLVVLGVVKQRILWPPEVGPTKEDPMCKSYDFSFGFPDAENPTRFPWAASGFQAPAMGQPVPSQSCDDCRLKEWGTHPGQKDSPWCTEQHSYIVLLPGPNNSFSPAIMVLQRTGLKPSRAYVSSFAQQRQPMFICVTHVSVSMQKRGTVDYAVPILGRGQMLPETMYEDFANRYRRIRDALRTPRTGNVDDVPVNAPVPSQEAAPAQPPQTVVSEPVAQPAQPAPQPAASAPDPAPAVQTAPSVPQDVAPAPVVAPTPVTVPADVAPAPVVVPADVAPAAAVPADVAPAAAAPVIQTPQAVVQPAQMIQPPQAVAAPQPASNVVAGGPATDDELPF